MYNVHVYVIDIVIVGRDSNTSTEYCALIYCNLCFCLWYCNVLTSSNKIRNPEGFHVHKYFIYSLFQAGKWQANECKLSLLKTIILCF